MPRALVEAAAALGVELSGTVEEAAGILVGGKLSPRSRFKYGYELGDVAEWCDEHGLGLFDLSPLDVAAMGVARRGAGIDPRNLFDALSFVYRHKPGGPEDVVGLARRVDRVWRVKNRDVRPPIRRAPVLPLQCWEQMRAAVGAPGYLDKSHRLTDERLARDRLIISLGLSGGLRPGELGRLSASDSGADETGRLVLRLAADGDDATTKTGRAKIAVPIGVPPFDAFPLADDFERLRRLRLARPEAGDHLVGDSWQTAALGGISAQTVINVLRKAARHAGIAGADKISGHSLRRSMVQIAAAGGWTLEQIAAVTGHASTSEIESSYLEGYGGVWARSDEGRQLLLGSFEGWEDSPVNWASGAARRARGPRIWWKGRDLEADRAEAAALARTSPRVGAAAAGEIDLIGRKWEAYCSGCGADPARPSKALLEMFAIDLIGRRTSHLHNSIRYLADYFAALPATGLADIPTVGQWVANAAGLGGRIAADNRRKAKRRPKRREIAPVPDEAMEKLFAQPLVKCHEGMRLLGLVLEQGRAEHEMAESLRMAFRFGEHTRIGDDRAELFAPCPAGAGRGGRRPAITVARSGGDPLWCGYEAARQLVAHYPETTLRSRRYTGPLTAKCTPLVRWLQARAAVAVLYATGLRPSDLDGFRWPDLRLRADGSVMWRLPYSKGNAVGDRVQILRLGPSDRPWCPVAALRRLAESLQHAYAAGWEEHPSVADSDGAFRRVFGPRAGLGARIHLCEPAGVDVRPQDFRYRKAAEIWAETRDIQLVRSTLFHRSETVSMGYVARGLPAETRAETDPLVRVYHKAGG